MRDASVKQKITDMYVRADGFQDSRTSSDAFLAFRGWIFRRIVDLVGDAESNRLVLPGINFYNQGLYSEALRVFTSAVKNAPTLEAEIATHLEICNRVLDVELDRRDIEYEISRDNWMGKSSLGRWFASTLSSGAPLLQVRCKYCGHYTPYIDPETGWAFLNSNNCYRCGRGYPMPDFSWDGVDGQAYIYYRGSVSSSEPFYQEFEQRFDVDPVMRVENGKWVKKPR